MTLRIYVRWPKQVVTDKTVTESEAVAAFAFDELKQRRLELEAAGAVGIAFSRDGEQADYVRLTPPAQA
jgi:hypothetical protein